MYIRTKDGVYEVEQSQLEDDEEVVNCDYGQIGKLEIKSKSENLEELCDVYIDEETQTIFHKHNGYVINWKTNMVYSLKEVAKHFYSVKGAIYTSKGLIYVAKMDSEGKLELI